MAQTVYRAWIARKMFYQLFERRIREFEVKMTMAVIIQRQWRGRAPRMLVKQLRQAIVDKINEQQAILGRVSLMYQQSPALSNASFMHMMCTNDDAKQQMSCWSVWNTIGFQFADENG